MGYIIEQLSGQAYADFINSNILQPLGMKSSTFDPVVAAKHGVATPTITLDDNITSVDLPFWQLRSKAGNQLDCTSRLVLDE